MPSKSPFPDRWDDLSHPEPDEYFPKLQRKATTHPFVYPTDQQILDIHVCPCLTNSKSNPIDGEPTIANAVSTITRNHLDRLKLTYANVVYENFINSLDEHLDHRSAESIGAVGRTLLFRSKRNPKLRAIDREHLQSETRGTHEIQLDVVDATANTESTAAEFSSRDELLNHLLNERIELNREPIALGDGRVCVRTKDATDIDATVLYQISGIEKSEGPMNQLMADNTGIPWGEAAIPSETSPTYTSHQENIDLGHGDGGIYMGDVNGGRLDGDICWAHFFQNLANHEWLINIWPEPLNQGATDLFIRWLRDQRHIHHQLQNLFDIHVGLQKLTTPKEDYIEVSPIPEDYTGETLTFGIYTGYKPPSEKVDSRPLFLTRNRPDYHINLSVTGSSIDGTSISEWTDPDAAAKTDYEAIVEDVTTDIPIMCKDERSGEFQAILHPESNEIEFKFERHAENMKTRPFNVRSLTYGDATLEPVS